MLEGIPTSYQALRHVFFICKIHEREALTCSGSIPPHPPAVQLWLARRTVAARVCGQLYLKTYVWIHHGVARQFARALRSQVAP